MGYSTYYSGSLTLEPKLPTTITVEQHEYSDWVISEDGTKISHNGIEKSYDQIEYLERLAETLKGLKIKLNGSLIWSGERTSDNGIIMVKNNVVRYKDAKELLDIVTWNQLK